MMHIRRSAPRTCSPSAPTEPRARHTPDEPHADGVVEWGRFAVDEMGRALTIGWTSVGCAAAAARAAALLGAPFPVIGGSLLAGMVGGGLLGFVVQDAAGRLGERVGPALGLSPNAGAAGARLGTAGLLTAAAAALGGLGLAVPALANGALGSLTLPDTWGERSPGETGEPPMAAQR